MGFLVGFYSKWNFGWPNVDLLEHRKAKAQAGINN
jgi:hypothetical protein